MKAVAYGVLLVGAGYLSAWGFLRITQPPEEDCPPISVTAAMMGEPPLVTDFEDMANWKFWEHDGEPRTVAEAAASQKYHPDEFQVDALEVQYPVETAFYLHRPEKVVQMFKDCEADENCFITFDHIPKSGGTSLETALSKVFNVSYGTSCCNEGIRDYFREKKEHFCQSKFSAWQLDHPLFMEILDTCFQLNVEKNRRVLVLISYREVGCGAMAPSSYHDIAPESLTHFLSHFPYLVCTQPISTIMSFIHQRCNKNFDKRAPAIQEACNVCHYESHTEVWDRFAESITAHLAGAWRVMNLVQDEGENSTKYEFPLDRMQVALMEPNDIDSFLKAFHPEMKFEKANPETLDRCNFRIPKHYLDKLVPAGEWYRRLVARIGTWGS
jgi:hypothetical protein